MQGLIIKLISGAYTVATNLQANGSFKTYVCKPRGTFRLHEISPKVGDRVVIEPGTKTILEVLPRKNELDRPFVSNVDKMFLIFSVLEPDLNLNLLDRLLAILEYNNIESIIILTKLDLLTDQVSINQIKEYYQAIGYKVYLTSKFENNETLLAEFKNNISVLAGQSGVGKSSLLNTFEPSLELKTQEISTALGRGKHTTRHTELHPLNGGWIADTPGFGIADFPFEDLGSFAHSFVEFFAASSKCKFSTCLHIDEPSCEVKKLVKDKKILKSRYENYLLFTKEIKENIENRY